MDIKPGVDFFHKELVESGKRIEPSEVSYEIYLNRNESAYELDENAKRRILEEVFSEKWKNYPTPYYPYIEMLIASYAGFVPENIATAAGSASIITALLNYFSANNRQIVIAEPSFSLYSFHCKSYNLKHCVWPLNNILEYDINLMPDLLPRSLVLLASPNNPVGNIIEPESLEVLINKYPQTLFLVDEVYNEFSGVSLNYLISNYRNLVLLRSFSKVFSSAGLRAGYLVADKSVTDQVRKLILPFSLNHLSVAFLRYVLNNPELMEIQSEYNKLLIFERERLFQEFADLDPENLYYRILPSHGNFLLISFKQQALFQKFIVMLDKAKIALLDVSNTPRLENSIRLTIGESPENNRVIEIIKELIL